MKPCSARQRLVSTRGWLSLRRHRRRPPSLLSVEVVDSGAASRGESGYPTSARWGLMVSAAVSQYLSVDPTGLRVPSGDESPKTNRTQWVFWRVSLDITRPTRVNRLLTQPTI